MDEFGGLADDMDQTQARLLRPAEVVELLGVSRSWLYEAARLGRIPCVRLGGPDGPIRFKVPDLEAWIDDGRISNREPAGPTGNRPSDPIGH